jgi:hypothetical protein
MGDPSKGGRERVGEEGWVGRRGDLYAQAGCLRGQVRHDDNTTGGWYAKIFAISPSIWSRSETNERVRDGATAALRRVVVYLPPARD